MTLGDLLVISTNKLRAHETGVWGQWIQIRVCVYFYVHQKIWTIFEILNGSFFKSQNNTMELHF